MQFRLIHKKLFIQKMVALISATVLLAPLIYYKLDVPAVLFVGGLLVLHLAFLYLYFSQVPWRRLLKRQGEFAVRVLGVAFSLYLLSLIKFGGNPRLIIVKLLLATGIHVAILAGLMVERMEPTTAQPNTL